MRPEVEIVRDGYDRMAPDYRRWAAGIDDLDRARMVADLDARLADGSAVLDLGCGNGQPTAAELARRHRVHGVDVSAAQVALARAAVPEATFACADLLTLTLPAASYDAVVCLYALNHVPRDEHARVLARIRTWLRPGGLLLITTGVLGDTDGIQPDFVGVPMFFSGFDAAANRRLIEAAGLQLLVADEVELQEPEGVARFQWIMARA